DGGGDAAHVGGTIDDASLQGNVHVVLPDDLRGNSQLLEGFHLMPTPNTDLFGLQIFKTADWCLAEDMDASLRNLDGAQRGDAPLLEHWCIDVLDRRHGLELIIHRLNGALYVGDGEFRL